MVGEYLLYVLVHEFYAVADGLAPKFYIEAVSSSWRPALLRSLGRFGRLGHTTLVQFFRVLRRSLDLRRSSSPGPLEVKTDRSSPGSLEIKIDRSSPGLLKVKTDRLLYG